MGRACFRWPRIALVALVAMLGGPAAAAEDGKSARQLYDEATAAFGLGRYADAAAKYEAAFSVRPDPALLYNAAQSYRLAGNKARALELYRNYVHLYPDRPNTADARNHIAALSRALQDEPAPAPGAGTPAPLPMPAAPPVTAAPVSAPAPALATTAPAPVLVAAAGPGAEEQPSLVRRPWFWVAVGAVLAGGALAVVLATRGTKYPDASLGTVPGN